MPAQRRVARRGPATVSGPWQVVDGPAGSLRVYSSQEGGRGDLPVLLLCHELPRARSSAADLGRAYPALVDRLAQESGWQVMVGMLRGAGGSDGDFSAQGWVEDVRMLVADVAGSRRVWIAGFDFGGCIGLRVAAADPAVMGVVTVGAPAEPATDPEVLLERCRTSGVVRRRGGPDDVRAWIAGVEHLDPVGAVASLGDRPLLVVHGADDRIVPPDAARALHSAATGPSELRIVPSAGHWLRADPRVVATLVGWLERRR